MLAPTVLSLRLFCCIRTEDIFFCFFKNVVLGTYKLVCMMNFWQK